jgi:N-acyl-D-aspartate/D-glutamate deacylase
LVHPARLASHNQPALEPSAPPGVREDAMLDSKIVGGEIVDGTGRAAFRGDVGIRDGRIVAIGQVDEPAQRTIDAAGKVVAPGFIDAHTHYDAQAFWDPTLSPSCYHGVTTIVGGFCGFSIAPVTRESAAYIKPMLARVEGMPLQTLEAAVPWDWSTFGEFLGKLDGRIGLNAGFFVGHSAIRRIVMGQRAVGETATPDDLAQMKALLDMSLSEGALGFSTTVSPSHNDGDGNPVPSRWADHSEIIALAGVVRAHEGAGLELLPDLEFGPGMAELLTEASRAAERPVNWNVLAVTSRPDAAAEAARKLAVTDYARERGGEVVALTIPGAPGVFMNLYTGVVFDALPGIWRELFKIPVAERIERFRDAAVRRTMAEDAARFPTTSVNAPVARFAEFRVVSTKSEQNKPYEGRLVGEIAAADGRAPLDAMLAIAVEDGLKTIFSPNYGGHERSCFELRGALWADDRTLIGGSDAGAHLDQIDTFAFSTELLQNGVRTHRVIGLEQAVHAITQRPARYFGLVDRGVIAERAHADVVVFDPATVGRGPTYMRYDLPGGRDFRLYADAIGISNVLVNGVEIVRDGEHTGALPGAVLRSGRDTRTPRLDALRRPGPRALA